jgi:hypothetical protein
VCPRTPPNTALAFLTPSGKAPPTHLAPTHPQSALDASVTSERAIQGRAQSTPAKFWKHLAQARWPRPAGSRSTSSSVRAHTP